MFPWILLSRDLIIIMFCFSLFISSANVEIVWRGQCALRWIIECHGWLVLSHVILIFLDPVYELSISCVLHRMFWIGHFITNFIGIYLKLHSFILWFLTHDTINTSLYKILLSLSSIQKFFSKTKYSIKL